MIKSKMLVGLLALLLIQLVLVAGLPAEVSTPGGGKELKRFCPWMARDNVGCLGGRPNWHFEKQGQPDMTATVAVEGRDNYTVTGTPRKVSEFVLNVDPDFMKREYPDYNVTAEQKNTLVDPVRTTSKQCGGNWDYHDEWCCRDADEGDVDGAHETLTYPLDRSPAFSTWWKFAPGSCRHIACFKTASIWVCNDNKKESWWVQWYMTDLMESLQRHCTDLTIDKKDRHWHGQIFGEGGGMNLIVGGIKDGGCKGFHPSGPNYAGN